jgi:hypothetical protein
MSESNGITKSERQLIALVEKRERVASAGAQLTGSPTKRLLYWTSHRTIKEVMPMNEYLNFFKSLSVYQQRAEIGRLVFSERWAHSSL